VSRAISLPLKPFLNVSLASLSASSKVENIKVVLEKRANDIIEREKQVAEEAKEQERVRMLQAQKQDSAFIVLIISFILFFG
jgi:hypothetical protein